MSSKLIYDYKVVLLEGGFEVRIVAYQVSKSLKFPDGIKLRCILLDLNSKEPRLLLDNHEPYGYHMHTKLPLDKKYRLKVEVKNYKLAIFLFLNEVRKLVKYEV